MKAVVVAAMLMACAAATPEHQRMFADFKSTHGRTYATEEEELKRFRVFSDNMKRAKELNRANPLARFGVNALSDISAVEFKSRHNAERHYATRKRSASPMELGATELEAASGQKIDWRTKGAVTPVMNQGACGSCFAFSTTGNIEGQWFLAGNPLTPLSQQELISCDTNDHGCNGGTMDLAFKWLLSARHGEIVTAAAYPFVSGTTSTVPACSANLNNMTVGATITAYRDLVQSEDQMAAFVYSSGPLSIAVDASSWQMYTGGVLTNCAAGPLDHCALIVGFDDTASTPYWIIKNSWGASWGEAGYIRVQKGTNQCDITGYPTTSVVAPTNKVDTTMPPTTYTYTTDTTSTPGTSHPTFPPYTPPHCPAVMPTYTMWFPMIYQGNIQYYDWLISLTNRSSDTPNAADAACPPSFIGQYSRGKSTPDACIINDAVSAMDTRLGCMWSFSQTYNSITQNFYVTVDCDQKATTMQAPAAFLVTPAGPNTYTYTATFRSSLVC